MPGGPAKGQHVSPATEFKPGVATNPGGLSREIKAQIAEVRRLALTLSPEAIAKLEQLMRNAASEQVQLAACNAILDRAVGKPKEFLAVEDKTEISTETQKTRDRLATLLARIAGPTAAEVAGADTGPTH